MALLNGQNMGPRPEPHQSPELTDAHWQLIVGLQAWITRPAKPMVLCANLCPLGRGSPVQHMEIPPDLLTTLCQPAHESNAVQSPNPKGSERRTHA